MGREAWRPRLMCEAPRPPGFRQCRAPSPGRTLCITGRVGRLPIVSIKADPMSDLRIAVAVPMVAVLIGCTAVPVDPPRPAVPPTVTLDARIKEDTVTLTSTVAAGGEEVGAHTVRLNGVVVRTGTASAWTITDTILPGGRHTFTAAVTTSGGTATSEFPFLVRELLPPVAQSPTILGDEAGSVSLNMTSVTSGEPDRTYSFAVPPTLMLERFGTATIRVRAAGTATTPADDVHGVIALPYTVADRNGSAQGTLQFHFRPQPDITITATRFLTGAPDTGSVRISLNGESHWFRTGTRVQARAGENVWALWFAPAQATFAELAVEGQDAAVPLNLNFLADTMTLGSDDLGAELTILGTTYPGLDLACRPTFESVYARIPADTVSSVSVIVLTQAAAGREAIAVGGESFLLWREAFDSLVAEEGRRAVQMNRAPRTFRFTTDLETVPRTDTFAHAPDGQPAAGQVWVYDSLATMTIAGIETGGRYFSAPAGDVLSGVAWSTPAAPAAKRHIALAKWFDGRALLAPDFPACSRHRDTGGPQILSATPHPIEAALFPLLQARANWLLLNRGPGYLQIR